MRRHHPRDMGHPFTSAELETLLPEEWDLECGTGRGGVRYYKATGPGGQALSSGQFQNILLRASLIDVLEADMEWHNNKPQGWVLRHAKRRSKPRSLTPTS